MTNGKFMVDSDGFSYFSPDGKALPKKPASQKKHAPQESSKK
jgi:hypothetical protein